MYSVLIREVPLYIHDRNINMHCFLKEVIPVRFGDIRINNSSRYWIIELSSVIREEPSINPLLNNNTSKLRTIERDRQRVITHTQHRMEESDYL